MGKRKILLFMRIFRLLMLILNRFREGFKQNKKNGKLSTLVDKGGVLKCG